MSHLKLLLEKRPDAAYLRTPYSYIIESDKERLERDLLNPDEEKTAKMKRVKERYYFSDINMTPNSDEVPLRSNFSMVDFAFFSPTLSLLRNRPRYKGWYAHRLKKKVRKKTGQVTKKMGERFGDKINLATEERAKRVKSKIDARKKRLEDTRKSNEIRRARKILGINERKTGLRYLRPKNRG